MLDEDDLSFHSYCIVCDKIIVAPKQDKKEGADEIEGKKKKKAQGTIRVCTPYSLSPIVLTPPDKEPGWDHHHPHGKRPKGHPPRS